jgi:superfamily II DNA or RNA helicase
MQVQFTLKGSRIQLKCDDRDLFDRIRLLFSIKNPNKRHSRFAQDRLYAMTPLGTFKPGLLKDLLTSINSIDPNIKVSVPQCVLDVAFPCNVQPERLLEVSADGFENRDYQEESVRLALKYGRGVILLATSAGKSFVIYNLIINLWKYHKKGKVLLMVPNTQLVRQMYDDILDYGCFKGEVCKLGSKDKVLNPDANIIISNRQWLEGHSDDLPELGIVLVDEAHGLTKSAKCAAFIESIPTNLKFGFTGTMPEDMENYWNVIGVCGSVLIERKAKDLQVDGFVAKLHIKAIKMDHNIPQPESDDEDALERAKKRYPLEWKTIEQSVWFNDFVIRLSNKLEGNTFILFDHTEHGRELERLCKASNTAKEVFYVDGSIDAAERSRMCAIMETRSDCILIGNTKCVGTGVSIKNLHNIVFAFTSGNANVKIIQSIGRSLRMRDDKDTAYIFDIFHAFKYSSKHFKERLKLYKENYVLESLTTEIVTQPPLMIL